MILNGWKEIATHLGRGVRTVQRWEPLGLPVRRPNARLRSSVICTTEELDAWVARCGSGRLQSPQPQRDLVDDEEIRERVDEIASQLKALSIAVDRMSAALQQLVARADTPKSDATGAERSAQASAY